MIVQLIFKILIYNNQLIFTWIGILKELFGLQGINGHASSCSTILKSNWNSTLKKLTLYFMWESVKGKYI